MMHQVSPSKITNNKEMAILLLTAFYPWRLFCHNHSCAFI